MFLLLIVLIASSALAEIDPATDQMVVFKQQHPDSVGIITTTYGAPVDYNEATTTLDSDYLIHNPFFMETITHLVRERTTERIVHGKGSGAFGYFEVTQNFSHICRADFLKKIGEKTPVAVRFSPAVGERGISELNRDFRGYAIKFFTREGNFDIPGFNTEMYFYKEPLKFRSFVHAARRNPATNLFDPTALWDTLTLNPESMHMFLLMFSDRGIPANYKNMPGYGIHLYQVENANRTKYFLKFHIIPDAGIKGLTTEEARNISKTQPDYFTTVLYRDISNGEYPTWTVSCQILTEADVLKLGARAIDVTRTISIVDFPLYELGKIVLNRMPKNFFAEMEQLAFCPAHLVPGIIGAPDKVFESRRLNYKDAHLYRLGVNANKIAANCPFRVQTYTYNRDGVPPVNNNELDIPNYYPNTFSGPVPTARNKTKLIVIKEMDAPDNFDQISDLYTSFLEDEKNRTIANIVSSLSQATEEIQARAVKVWTTINSELGNRVNEGLIAAAASADK